MAIKEESGREYVERKGWHVAGIERTSAGEQLILKICPLCKSEASGRHKGLFHINASNGLWLTYCCGQSGNLWQLKRELGDLKMRSIEEVTSWGMKKEDSKMAQNFKRVIAKRREKGPFSKVDQNEVKKWARDLLGKSDEAKTALEYLTKVRCLSKQVIKESRLGYTTRYAANGEEVGVVSIPIFYREEIVNVKFRVLPEDLDKAEGQRFLRMPGCRTVLYGIDDVKPNTERIILCEAEIDRLSMLDYGFDKSSVVSLSAGASKLDDDSLEWMVPFNEILILMDSDDPGEKAADIIADQLGRYRCRRVRLPLKDPGDCLRAGISREDIQRCVESAAECFTHRVQSPGDLREEVLNWMDDPGQAKGRTTGWTEVDDLIGGVRDGDFVIVTGETGVGKTTWLTALMHNRSVDNDSTLIASFEMRPAKILRKMTSMEIGESLFKVTPDVVEDALDRIEKRKIYFLDAYGHFSVAALEDVVEYGVRRFGVQRVVIDNLQFFLDDSEFGGDERKAVDNTIMRCKYLTDRLNITIYLVVHPKTQRIFRGKVLPPEIHDLRGSAMIKTVADLVLRVGRPNEKDKKKNKPLYENNRMSESLITSLKIREDFVGKLDSCLLAFNCDSLRYGDSSLLPLSEPDADEDLIDNIPAGCELDFQMF